MIESAHWTFLQRLIITVGRTISIRGCTEEFMKLLQPKKMIISNGQERFLSPCYEQLRAAFHALDEADKNEFSSGRVPDVTKLDDSPSDRKAWLVGFFFNSAVHRIAWATDRLLELFCYLPDQDQQDLQLSQSQTGIGTLRTKAKARLKEGMRSCQNGP